MDLLRGFPDVDEIAKPLGTDDVKLLDELHHCFDNATIVEEMLVALLHMQVAVCYLRQGRRRQYNGMPAFRKNIIAFPQELAGMKQLPRFWTSVKAGDLVNAAPAEEVSDEGAAGLRRAKVLALKPSGFDVRDGDDLSEEHVPFARIRARVCSP